LPPVTFNFPLDQDGGGPFNPMQDAQATAAKR